MWIIINDSYEIWNNTFSKRKWRIKRYNEITGDGFGFQEPNGEVILRILSYAISIYKDKKQCDNIIKNAKARDNSWDTSVDKYIEVYKKILKK